MEGMAEAEAWDLEDNIFRVDTDSSIAFTQSLWDEFYQSEIDVNTFASTPSSDIKPFEKRNIDQLNCKEHHFSENSPSVKRRRMLDFPNGNVNSCDLNLEPVSPIFLTESDDYILDSRSSQIQEHTSGESMWYMGNDDSLSSVDDATCVPAESWMARYSTDTIEQLTEDQMNVRSSLRVMPENPVLKRQKVGQGIQTVTPACRGTMTTGRTPTKPTAKLATPVAYPFAIIKPIGLQGDVTLDDINQRIMMPPSKSAPHVASAKTPSFSRRLSNYASSGKSVVALTKIHTEGRGTITIIRTKN